MKLLLVVLILGCALNADEMKRIEAIVGDITKLRAEYDGCQTESKIYELQLKDERDKNRILHQELNSFKNLYKREIEYKNKIKKLENKIKEQDKLLKTKELPVKNLDTKKKIITKVKQNDKNSLKNKEKNLEGILLVKCEEPNPFPKLLMKKEFMSDDKKNINKLNLVKPEEKKLASSIVKQKEVLIKEKVEKFKASAFRLNKNAAIYDEINGKVIEEWEKGTSFTSSIKTQNWIKITGYFVDRVWMRSPKDIWIKLSDTTKR